MYQKETKDERYRNDPFRAVNFKTDESRDLICLATIGFNLFKYHNKRRRLQEAA